MMGPIVSKKHRERRGYTLAMSLRVSCGVNRRIVDKTRTRFGWKECVSTYNQPAENGVPSYLCVQEIEG